MLLLLLCVIFSKPLLLRIPVVALCCNFITCSFSIISDELFTLICWSCTWCIWCTCLSAINTVFHHHDASRLKGAMNKNDQYFGCKLFSKSLSSDHYFSDHYTGGIFRSENFLLFPVIQCRLRSMSKEMRKRHHIVFCLGKSIWSSKWLLQSFVIGFD